MTIPNMPFSLSQGSGITSGITHISKLALWTMPIVDNANFELCVIPLVIPSQDGIIGIVHNASFELCVIPLVIPSLDGIIGIM